MATSDFINNIICGDAYELIKQLDDKSIDCIYTDIPYLYNNGGSGSSELGKRTAKKVLELIGCEQEIIDDKNNYNSKSIKKARETKNQDITQTTSIEDGIDFKILDEYVRVMKKVNIFIWCSKLQILDLMNYFLNGKLNKTIYFEILTWNKTNPTPTTNNSWLPDIEYCLYFKEQGILYNDGYDLKHKWYMSPTNTDDKDKFLHPTIKPLEIVERHLKHTTQEGDLVLDTFIGSGTTAVACKNLNRNFIGFEINKKWCQIANDRINGVDAYGQQSFVLL